MKLQLYTLLQRLYFPLTFSRVILLLLGFVILGQGIVDMQWLGIIIGAYFLMSGLFSLGCAGGYCPNPNQNNVHPENKKQ
jgi:hypothetical protein